jgi:hypothetical protein
MTQTMRLTSPWEEYAPEELGGGRRALGAAGWPAGSLGYLSKTRVPRIFCVLKVPRNTGITLSISSK